MRGPDDTVDRRIARFARRQHGVAGRRQLLAAGVSARQIEERLRKGTLIRVYPGVYRVGHVAPSVQADYLAAVLACGDGAFLRDEAAAHLLGIVKGGARAPQVSAPGRRVIDGIETKRAPKTDPRDLMTRQGIRMTTPARTLVDLAAVLGDDDLARAVHEAGIRHGVKPHHVEAVLARRPRSTGAQRLRGALRGDTKVTLSKLEQAFLRLLGQNELPLPITNRPTGGRFVDCRWPEHKLTVELDSYTYHNSRHAFEQDRKRERDAYRRGDQLRRYTWGDVTEQPRAVLRELRAVLAPV